MTKFSAARVTWGENLSGGVSVANTVCAVNLNHKNGSALSNMKYIYLKNTSESSFSCLIFSMGLFLLVCQYPGGVKPTAFSIRISKYYVLTSFTMCWFWYVCRACCNSRWVKFTPVMYLYPSTCIPKKYMLLCPTKGYHIPYNEDAHASLKFKSLVRVTVKLSM